MSVCLFKTNLQAHLLCSKFKILTHKINDLTEQLSRQESQDAHSELSESQEYSRENPCITSESDKDVNTREKQK